MENKKQINKILDFVDVIANAGNNPNEVSSYICQIVKEELSDGNGIILDFNLFNNAYSIEQGILEMIFGKLAQTLSKEELDCIEIWSDKAPEIEQEIKRIFKKGDV